jgi:hypothetical protein
MSEYTDTSKSFVSKFFVPVVVLVWSLVSLGFLLSTPPANSQSDSGCASSWEQAMSGVYSPQRLSQETLCQAASGEVTYVEKWGDGDWDVYLKNISPSGLVSASDIRNLQLWREAQKTRRHDAADMLWEIVPQDQGRCAKDKLTKPSAGDSLKVQGAYVYDTNHGYHEIHPVYQETYNGKTCTSSNYQ